MLTLKEWMELVDYKINEGWEHQWQCYGHQAQGLDSTCDEYSSTIIFDRETQIVYEVQMHDYRNDRAYRMINPDFEQAHRNEADSKSVNHKQAWDSVDFVDLEVDDDFIQKCLSIKAGEDYDTRVSVPLNLPDDELFMLMRMAHDRDLTFNEFVEDILWKAINEENLLRKSRA